MDHLKSELFSSTVKFILNLSIDESQTVTVTVTQSTSMYHLKVSRGPHNFSSGLACQKHLVNFDN